jgi:hypothetical protein
LDAGLHADNPVDQLAGQVIRQVQKRGIDANLFFLQVDGNWRELFLGGPKARLALPKVNEFRVQIFNRDFASFLRQIELHPNHKRSFSPVTGQVRVTIAYAPKQRSFGCNYLSYDVFFTLENNPIHNRLERKATQLRDSGYGGGKE